MRRTSRWASTPITELATRNDSIPMSRKRWSAEVESVACRVENTRWPVSADCTAMRAVSTSRISPTRVLAEDRLETAGEGDVGLLVDLDLVDGRQHVLDRVLDRRDVALDVADLVQHRVERRRLAAARRSRTDDHAERRAHELRERLARLRRHAEIAQFEQRALAIEHPHDHLLAPDRRHRADAHVELA